MWLRRRNNHFKCRALHALSRGPEVRRKAYTFRVQRRTHPTAKYKSRAEASGKTRSVGLARALSKLGYASRAQAAELIAAGRVRLNGTVRRNAEAPVLLGQDKIASDEKGRETVYDYIGEGEGWLAPVGRLDKASEGLLLLTNDSEWAARVLDPARHVAKTYHVQMAALADEALLEALRRGVRDGGDFLRVELVRELRRGERNSWLEIVLHEGKNRHIRRMLESLGIEVLRLVRVAIGALELGDLGKGESRKLSAAEKAAVESWNRT